MSQYNKRLDRSREFGSCHPPDREGNSAPVFYWQDGYPFDHEGRLVDDRLTAEQRETLSKKAAAKPAAAPQQAKPPKPSKGDGEGDGSPQSGEGGEDGPNLEAWLRGEEDHEFEVVRQAVKKRYNVFKTSKRDLVEFLVADQKLVPPGEVSDGFKSLLGLTQ